MHEPSELTYEECATLLRAGVVGRAALATTTGPEILPVNYSVVDESIVIRTSPYSVLARFGVNARIAFEVDHFDREFERGWSVVAHGTSSVVQDAEQFERIRAIWEPRPWAGGAARNLYLRLTWTELTGRRLGTDWDLMADLDVRENPVSGL